VKEKVIPLCLDDAMDRLQVDSAAGYSFPKRQKKEVLPEIKAKAKDILRFALNGQAQQPIPAIIGTRGKLQKKRDEKYRMTFNIPAEMQVLEQMFVGPLTDRFLSEGTCPMVFGKGVIAKIKKITSKYYGRGKFCLQWDISALDNTIPEQVMRDAFTILEGCIDFENFEGKKQCLYQQKRWKRLYEYLQHYEIYTPVMGPDGKLRIYKGGVSSGSGFTQLIDSVVTTLYTTFVCEMLGLSIEDIYVLGDDLFLATGEVDLDKMKHILFRVFRVTLNVDKTKIYDGRLPEKKNISGLHISRWEFTSKYI